MANVRQRPQIAREADGRPRWRRVMSSWPGIIGTTLGLIVAAGAAWKVILPLVWAADIQVAMTCHPRSILLHVRNEGGNPATFEDPRFEMVSERRWHDANRHPFDMSALDNPFAQNRVINPAESRTFEYANDAPFFGRNETEGGACSIHAAVAVNSDGKRSVVPGECPCEYP